jgi:hypothetical protein
MYFNKLGTTEYNNVTIPDILKRIVIGQDALTSELVEQYTIAENETPESLSFNYYGKVDYYWVIMLINNIKSRFFDWPMGSYELGKYTEEKYGNKTAVFFAEEEINSKYPMCLAKFVVIEGKKYKVYECDRNLNKIVIDKIKASDITNPLPLLVGLQDEKENLFFSMRTEKIVYENEVAVHHFEGNEQYPRQHIQDYIRGDSLTNTISNQEFESKENENKREIVLIKPEYLLTFVNEFKRIANE